MTRYESINSTRKKYDGMLINNDTNYKLLQFHVHQKAEHTIDDKKYDLELHFVFVSDEGFIFALGFLTKAVSAEKYTSKIFQKLLLENHSEFLDHVTFRPLGVTPAR